MFKMKAGVWAIAAAIVSGVSAGNHHVRHLHAERGVVSNNNHNNNGSTSEPDCGCTTVYYTYTGEGGCTWEHFNYVVNFLGIISYILYIICYICYVVLYTRPY